MIKYNIAKKISYILLSSVFLHLFWEFFKIGLFAVGGGFATIPFLYNLTYIFPEICGEDISDIIAVATVLPGPIGVSSATFVGWKIAGIWGGIIAAAGLITPSVIVIIAVAKVFLKIKDNRYVLNAFCGLRPVVCGLIAACGFAFLKNGIIKDTFQCKILILFIITASCMIFIKKIRIHPIVYIFIGALSGIIFRM